MLKIIFTPKFWVTIIVTFICTMIGTYLAGMPYLNIIGSLVLALIFGMLLQVQPKITRGLKAEAGFISNKFLRLGIILLGFKLNLNTLMSSGIKTILLAILVVLGTITGTYLLNRKLGVNKELSILTASGTGICGAAAVMGISPQIKVSSDKQAQKEEDQVLAVAIVAIMGTVFTLIEIAIKPLLHMAPDQFGVMAGGSLHEIAHAVATGSSDGPVALNIAIITKLSRVLMLAPAALIIGIWYQKTTTNGEVSGKRKLPIPWFMAGFILTSIIGTYAHFSAGLLSILVNAAYIFLGMAMAALGMTVNFKVLLNRGVKPLIASFTSSVILLVFVIIVSKLFF
ncbi:YeiH family protein [Apilactobacillus micheneri]|uniref:Sulfate exporter family transporter n=1 Tax=Apilactobacillus micheneri TaxID=1899430 RepID=A0A9Q8MU83_9LACO|nr:putative sulfate exporter family transporter [Apilactobacillus micheneri]TPR40955.1 putative sulfate exporter family transporter [Apilactobacillus micheneri]TPR42535.1 putative sulfate exporter family transporter [Apilactobacillus micheneri]TPR46062.1 putative sulfate exporter family transporter [Apilactobacillus micheneri]TPR46747.1 putative sulfate exporter family transporter [Apilactobacillus micheneri]TPR50007.1 putative sulfate exporter family transporter [Apilactobacillus micheneri]